MMSIVSFNKEEFYIMRIEPFKITETFKTTRR